MAVLPSAAALQGKLYRLLLDTEPLDEPLLRETPDGLL